MSAIDGPAAWRRLAICVVLAAIGNVGMWSVVVVLPMVQSDFGVDRATASIPYTATMIGFALGNAIVGRYVDRLGITRPIIAAAMALGIGFVSAALVTNIWLFAAIQGALIGVGTSVSFGPLIADLSHWFKRRRGIAVALAASGNYMAGAIWPQAMQPFLPTEGWRATYMGIGLICVVCMVPLALMLRAPPPHADPLQAGSVPRTAEQPLPINVDPKTLQSLLIIAGVCCCVAMSMPQVHIVAYCSDLGYGVAVGAEMLSILVAGGVVSRIASGFIADRVGGLNTLLLGSVLQSAALCLYIPFDGLMPLYIVSLVFGLSQGGIVPSYAIIVREYFPAREAGARVGIVIMATIFGMALGGWLSGWIFDLTGSYKAAFLNGVVWNLLNAAIAISLLMRTRQPKVA